MGELRSLFILVPSEEDLIRIFVVDDSAIFRTQLRKLLEGRRDGRWWARP